MRNKLIIVLFFIFIFHSCSSHPPIKNNFQTIEGERIEITDEEIKKETEFGFSEKLGSVVLGFFWGFPLGCSATCIYHELIEDTNVSPMYGSFTEIIIGGCTGTIVASIVSYKFLYHCAKKEALERLVEEKKRELQQRKK